MFSKKDIVRYYDLSEIHYRLHWNLDKSRSLHYGYWDASTKNFHEALLNINKILSHKIQITKEDVVLDAGCGVGGSSVWMAKHIGCKVTGISLSEKQVHTANELAAKEGVGHLAKFYVQDFTNTGFEKETYDVVWAIESVCHAPDKSAFLNEAFKLLKKNGRIILADFFKKENLEGTDAQQIQKWAHSWAVADFSTQQKFEKQLQDSGFSEIQVEDATHAILHSAKRLYTAYFIGLIPTKIYQFFYPNATELAKRNVYTAYYQYKTLKKQLWKYLIFSVVKK
jgi:cyclopropane fatty-acyl-phospholipid synthase-like methyltransferase